MDKTKQQGVYHIAPVVPHNNWKKNQSNVLRNGDDFYLPAYLLGLQNEAVAFVAGRDNAEFVVRKGVFHFHESWLREAYPETSTRVAELIQICQSFEA